MQASRQEQAIDVTNQVALDREVSGAAGIGYGNEGHRQPITDQDSGSDPRSGQLIEFDEKQGGKHPCQTDTGQDTGIAEIGEIE